MNQYAHILLGIVQNDAHVNSTFCILPDFEICRSQALTQIGIKSSTCSNIKILLCTQMQPQTRFYLVPMICAICLPSGNFFRIPTAWSLCKTTRQFSCVQVLHNLLDQLLEQGQETRGIQTSAELFDYLKDLLALESESQS